MKLPLILKTLALLSLIAASAALYLVTAHKAHVKASGPAESRDQRLYNTLKHFATGTHGQFSEQAAQTVAGELVRYTEAPDAIAQPLQDFLAKEQMDIQLGYKAPLDEKKLLASLNKRAGLASGPEYLQFRSWELRKMRLSFRTEFPELAGGNLQSIMRKSMDTITPFEAYFTLARLADAKQQENEYVPTAAEEEDAELHPPEPRPPGAYVVVVAPNPRREEFRARLAALEQQFGSADIISALHDVAAESRHE